MTGGGGAANAFISFFFASRVPPSQLATPPPSARPSSSRVEGLHLSCVTGQRSLNPLPIVTASVREAVANLKLRATLGVPDNTEGGGFGGQYMWCGKFGVSIWRPNLPREFQGSSQNFASVPSAQEGLGLFSGVVRQVYHSQFDLAQISPPPPVPQGATGKSHIGEVAPMALCDIHVAGCGEHLPAWGLRDDRIPGTDQAVRGGRHGQKLHSGFHSPPVSADAHSSADARLVMAEGPPPPDLWSWEQYDLGAPVAWPVGCPRGAILSPSPVGYHLPYSGGGGWRCLSGGGERGGAGRCLSGGGGWHKALGVGSVRLWQRLLASHL